VVPWNPSGGTGTSDGHDSGVPCERGRVGTVDSVDRECDRRTARGSITRFRGEFPSVRDRMADIGGLRGGKEPAVKTRDGIGIHGKGRGDGTPDTTDLASIYEVQGNCNCVRRKIF
ncbi:MAG: hypothetical protein IKK40_01635, partial [Bacteroidales bacterium]|nr:hypothetical protein [Bacteroidales bacterium]